MPETPELDAFLSSCHVDTSVWELRGDYRALLVATAHLVPGPSDESSDALLTAAEAAARGAIGANPIEALTHVAAWRDAYRAFGAKPQRTRNSLEALLRRVETGIPRINRLTDLYNATSIRHQIPVGGEDLTRYRGGARLVRATGLEEFDTVDGGVSVTEHPETGEVVWRDDHGVTCRRWNWRQSPRTQLREDTTSALFIFDALDPVTDEALVAAADDLVEHLRQCSPHLHVVRRFVSAPEGA